MSEVCAIFAIGPDNVIGIDDKMPWHSKQDFYHFKQITKGYPCIFGNKTFFGLPKYPLSDRLNVVVSSEVQCSKIISIADDINNSLEDRGSFIEVPSIETAINLCKHYSKIFICGGRSVYKYCLEKGLVDAIYLTQVDSNKLAMKIAKKPEAYIRFPIDLTKFLKSWKSTKITYTEDIDYPEDEEDLSVLFTRFSRN